MNRSLWFCVAIVLLGGIFFLGRPATDIDRYEPRAEQDPDAVNRDQGPVRLFKTTLSNYLTNITQIGLHKDAGAINCLAISETDSNRMLAAAQNGGVWLSTNRGKSWMPVNDYANSLKVVSLVQNHFKHNEFYYATGIDIYQNNVLLYDIYKSTDGGQTFNNVTASAPSFGAISKIVCSPKDSNTIYFSKFNTPTSSGGNIYRTTDNFATFQKVFQATALLDDFIVLPGGEVEVSEGHNIWKSPNGNLGTFVLSSTGIGSNMNFIRLSACQSQPNIQYAVASFGNYFGVYKTTNGAGNWTFIDTIGIGSGPFIISVKPDDPNFVMCGAVQLYASTNGGVNWQISQGGYDNRSINYDPNRPGNVFITSDFGISSLEVSPLTATSFTALKGYDSTLNAQEVYGGDYSAVSSRTVMGCQDLGSQLINGNLSSLVLMSGDGGYAFCSKQDSTKGYYSTQGGVITRSVALNSQAGNFVLNQLDANNNLSIDEGSIFIHPYVMNEVDDDQLYLPTLKRLWRTTDGGANWVPISHSYGNSHYRLYLAASKKPNPVVFWCNYDSVFAMANARTSSLTEIGVHSPAVPVNIAIDANNDSCVYFIKEGAPAKIFHSSNFFAGNVQWTDIATNFPANVSPTCLAVYPGNSQVMVVGSLEGGIYITVNGGQTWDREANFPWVQIKQIKIRPTDHKLFIFTFGRGAWTADLDLNTGIQHVAASAINIFPNPFTDNIHLVTKRQVKNVEVSMMSVQGNIVFKQSMDIDGDAYISPDALPAGVYVISLRAAGNVIASQQIIKR